MIRNYYIFGEFNLANRGEQSLLARAYKTEYSFQKIKEAVVYSFSESLGSKFFPNPKIEPKDFQFQEDFNVRNKNQNLINQGKSQADINKIFKREAIAIIKKHPIKIRGNVHQIKCRTYKSRNSI